MSKAVLSLRHVSLHHGLFKALDDIDLEVERGERLAIIGPNGAGKSSLLDMLSGFYQPSVGEIWLQGRKINSLSMQKRVQAGLVRSFQQSRLFADMTVFENLQCAAFAKQVSWWQQHAFWRSMNHMGAVNDCAQQVLQQMGLESSAQTKTSDLSYASQRLLELGMVLATGAQTLLLDEPTAGLSRAQADDLCQRMDALKSTHTVLMVEHDMSTVLNWASRILVLNQGQVVACDTPQAIMDSVAVRALYGEIECERSEREGAC